MIPCEDCVAWQPAGGQEPGHESAQRSGFDLYFGSTEPHIAKRRREAKLGGTQRQMKSLAALPAVKQHAEI